MKKLLTLTLVLVFLMSLIPSAFISRSDQAYARTANINVVHNASSLSRIGYDWDGVTKLDPPRDVPWVRPGEEWWGRSGYHMPSAVRARQDGVPVPVLNDRDASAVSPVFYTQIFLEVRAEGGISTLRRPFYAVIDDDGQLWLDEDGYFHDSRYDRSADPIAQNAFGSYFPNEPFINNAYQMGSCHTNPNALIDPDGINNTRGPYFLNPENPFYTTRQYFWDDQEDELSEATNRMWQIGWADMVDYPFAGAVLGDMTVSDGLVRVEYFSDGRVNREESDWDFGLPLVSFNANERHTGESGYSPGNMSTGELHDFIYRAEEYPWYEVEIGDRRLTAVSIKIEDEIRNYPPDTLVQEGDWDIGLPLSAFSPLEKHVDNIAINNVYDPGEWIYRLTLDSDTVTDMATRLTNVNGKIRITPQGIFREHGTGMHTGDVLLMLEVTENVCTSDQAYDVHVLTDVFMGQSPSYAAAKLRSPNGDIVANAQRIQKSTVLDTGLDENRFKTLPGTTFHNLRYRYRQFVGLEIFFDNGINNMKLHSRDHDVLAPLDLTDNYREERTGEQFIGARNFASTLDIGRRLTPFTDNYRYYDAGGDPEEPQYGCGEAIYWLPNPNDPQRETDIDGNLLVQAGDRRFTDIELYIGDVLTEYQRNTVVTPGDADVGLPLFSFDRVKMYIPNYDSITPDTSAPFEYDPNYIDLYFDHNDNGVVDFGDIRLSEVKINETTYPCGSEVSFGDVWFLESHINMITTGMNGSFNFMDTKVLPGDIGLNVEVDPPLMVEQTSRITVSVDPPPAKGEEVYVSIQEPQANEFNFFRRHVYQYDISHEVTEYDVSGRNMDWYGVDRGWSYELPFDFFFIDRTYRKVFISSNGFLNFSQNEPIARPMDQFDARLMVYGDSLRIARPDEPVSIHDAVESDGAIENKQPQGIYISQTSDSITIRWRAQTFYTVTPGAGSYISNNGANNFGLVDAQVTLFANGDFTLNYMLDMPPQTTPDEVHKRNNRVNNIRGTSPIVPAGPIVGATDGMGLIFPSTAYNGLKNVALVDGLIQGGTYVETPRLTHFAAEVWKRNVLPFNEPHFGYPRYNELKPFSSFAILTHEKPTATFHYTPYTGTINEVGLSDWVEIRAYKDIGGSTTAPPDSTYTFLREMNYADPTIWESRWTRTEYWRYPWASLQKTRFFVYPPTRNLIPRELSGTYDCFGLERLIIEPEPLEIKPSRTCVSILDERQPIVTLDVRNYDNPLDVNDPNGMAMASTRRTVVFQGIDVDFALVNHPPAGAPAGSSFILIPAAMGGLFRVGDYVYIETGLPTPMYRRIVAIQPSGIRVQLWFELPIHVGVPNGSQIVQNPLIANYNVQGAGINGMFTTIGAAGQRYIVQVRDDGRYDFWRWYEPLVPGQVRGVVDPTDWFYSWQDMFCPDRDDNSAASEPLCASQTLYRIPFPMVRPRPPLGLEDMTCTLGDTVFELGTNWPNFPRIGEWSFGDRYGIFGNDADRHWAYPNGRFVTPFQPFGPILTWGVPTLLTPKTYPNPTDYREDDGGKATIVAWPTDPSTPMKIRLYTTAALFDYNSTVQHPGHYIVKPGMGIDYLGETSVNVAPANPDVNFTDVSIIDHGLKNSRVNYTAGASPLYPMDPPSPQIGARYFPMATDFNRDVRAYPGGQSHAGRVRMNFFDREHMSGSAWNAYPAIWRDKFVKLGTEFMPQTDYGLAFHLKGDHPYDYLSFINGITRIVVRGPFATPKKVMEDQLWGSAETAGSYLFRLNARYEYNGYENVPIHYDFSGEIEVDNTNRQFYEIFMPDTPTGNNVNFALATNPTAPFDFIRHQGQDVNPWLVNNFGGYDHRWSYFGVGRYGPIPPNTWLPNNVFLFDELIPVGHGAIEIEIDYRGDTYTFTDCCEDPYMTNIPVQGISIDGAPDYLEIDQDHELRLTLTESTRTPDQETQYSNNALLMVWQDRGILDPLSGNLIGMGDGHITNPPRASSWHHVGKQFAEHHDLNRDGKISFEDFETEVMGTYDLATNTWSSGMIDGRTFMRDNGEYRVNLSAANGSQLTTIGYDFGGIPTDRSEFDREPDHIISKYETLPIYINAYKYGDDNNDRGFTPLWRQIEPYEYSHEVYLSGMAKIEPAPVERLIVTTSPDVITAGVTPELIDPEEPLSFTVMDDQGNPVNLFHGIENGNGQRRPSVESVHNLLFYDPHPNEEEYFGRGARLPDYYWIRTDLHNFDGTLYDNNSIYMSTMAPFNPISVDFDDADQGLYRFYGFTANDAGYFVVRVYTPDRRSYGDTVVNVSLPDVHYTIINDEDPNQTEYHVPGDPDFIMTALDLRSYTITAQVFDAQGRPLRSFQGDEGCEGVPARFTPFSTYVRNLEFRSAIMTETYYNMLGYDRNNNGKIDLMNRERLNMAGFTFYGIPVTYYTGILRHPLDEGFRINPIHFPVRDDVEYYGMGLGAIYNSRHYGTLMFADLDSTGRADEDKQLTFADSLILDEEGRVTFKVFLNDIGMHRSNIGGLVGLNTLSINPQTSNIYGLPNYGNNPFAPFDVWKRYRYTGKRFIGERGSAFQLDWDAHANRSIEVGRPLFELLDAQTRRPMNRHLLDENAYDLRYGIENHIIIRAHQADPRDLPIKDAGLIQMEGSRDERSVQGKMVMGPDNLPEASIRYTPTGTGRLAGYIHYYVKNQGFAEFSDHITLGMFQLVNFDSVNSLSIEIVSVGKLTPNLSSTLRLRVVESATRGPIAEARVRLRGAGVNENTRTNEQGITEIEITPDREGVIEIEATRHNHLDGSYSLFVGRDTRPLFLHVDSLPELTNQPNQTLRGYTKTHSRVWINDREARVDEEGKFEQTLSLQEGSNDIVVRAEDETDKKEEQVTIILDTQTPEITLHDPGTLVDVTEVVFRGTVSKPSAVTVNDRKADVIGTNWQLNIPVNYGKNILSIKALDKAGNESTVEKEIYVYQRWVVEIRIGSNSVYLNGVPQPPLTAPPYIRDGHTMVPIRLIAETFDAEVQWREASREIVILMEGKIVIMRIGDSEATINGIPMELSVPPEIVEGTTFVPLRFITDALEFEVEWIASTRTIRIIKLV